MADDGDNLGQDEIESLLQQAKGSEGAVEKASQAAIPEESVPPATGDAAGPSNQTAPSADDPISRDVDLLLTQAEQAIASVDAPADSDVAGIQPFSLPDLGGAPPSTDRASLELLRDVELDLRIELGRTQMFLEDVLELRRGSVVPLDKLAGDPVDVYVNGRLVARGEVLVMNDSFCVRVAELVSSETQS